MENLEEFLKDLTELTKKHKIEIAGCGCCGSPFLNELKEEEKESEYVYTDRLEWKRYASDRGHKQE